MKKGFKLFGLFIKSLDEKNTTVNEVLSSKGVIKITPEEIKQISIVEDKLRELKNKLIYLYADEHSGVTASKMFNLTELKISLIRNSFKERDSLSICGDLSHKSKGLWKNESYRKILTAQRNTPEYKMFVSERNKKLWQNPEHIKKMCKPVEVDGKSYGSSKLACKELNIALTTLRRRCFSPSFPNYKYLTKESKK